MANLLDGVRITFVCRIELESFYLTLFTLVFALHS